MRYETEKEYQQVADGGHTTLDAEHTTFSAQTSRQDAITKAAYFQNSTFFFTVNNKTDRNERKTTVPDTGQ